MRKQDRKRRIDIRHRRKGWKRAEGRSGNVNQRRAEHGGGEKIAR